MDKPKVYFVASHEHGERVAFSHAIEGAKGIFVLEINTAEHLNNFKKYKKEFDDILEPEVYEIMINGEMYLIGKNVSTYETHKKLLDKLDATFEVEKNGDAKSLEKLIHVLAAASRVCSELR